MTATRFLPALLVAAMAAVLVVPDGWAGGGEAARADETRFPHARHRGLFPSCTGCHGGVLAGRDSATVPLMAEAGQGTYPLPSACTGCHDGTRYPRVAWNGPAREPSNLRFSHAAHNAEADLGEPELNCGQCHRQQGSTLFMAVAQARPEPCIACHGHPAPAHLAESSPCRTCHLPVTRAVALTSEQIEAFPEPPSHRDPDFIVDHGPTVAQAEGQCAVCHSRESCARCHANAGTVAAIRVLEPDPRVARLAGERAPVYPMPASHRDPEWSFAHGASARARIATCANCHTQPGCRECHTGRLGQGVIARLPADSGRGVQLRGHDPATEARPQPPAARVITSDGDVVLQGAPMQGRDTSRVRRDTSRVRVHPPGFETRHGAAAASERLTCEGCHATRSFCTQCHDGEERRRFHPGNFLARHPSDAYAQRTECASCHSREAFCGECHQRAGLQAAGGRDVAYHTAQPLWLIQHGRAARQGLETCTTCHVQRDCMQCHSTTGWSVNPHGRGFDPQRMASRNAQICRACHIGDPLARP